MSSRQILLTRTYIAMSFEDQDLTGAILTGEFIGVDFRGTTLTDAILSGTFIDVDFRGAVLHNVDLTRGRFINPHFDATVAYPYPPVR